MEMKVLSTEKFDALIQKLFSVSCKTEVMRVHNNVDPTDITFKVEGVIFSVFYADDVNEHHMYMHSSSSFRFIDSFIITPDMTDSFVTFVKMAYSMEETYSESVLSFVQRTI